MNTSFIVSDKAIMTSISAVGAVIFDMDGLLFDTEAIGRWAWDRSLQEHGYVMTDAIYRQFVGRDMRHRERILKAHFGTQFPFESVKTRRIVIGDKREIEQGLALKPGVLELLDHFCHLDVRIGLATGTVRERAERRLKSAGIDNFFHAIVASDEVQRGKPAPDIFLETSRQLAVPSQGCIVFEDSCAGVEGASSAGMRVVMVPDLEAPSARAILAAYCVLGSLHEAIGALSKLEFAGKHPLLPETIR